MSGIELTEEEKDKIREGFDAWGHDYTELYPVVEEIVENRMRSDTVVASANNEDDLCPHGLRGADSCWSRK